jgi:hypothetical protein
MRFIAIFAVLASLHTSAHCQDAQESSAISELAALITDIPAVIVDGGAQAADGLAKLLSALDPQGVVSDLPAIFSADLPLIESFFGALLTAIIPPGAAPTSIVAEIPAFAAEEGSRILSDLDKLVTEIPGTLSLADPALPSYLGSLLPEFGSDLEGIASAMLADLTKSLGSASTAPANATARTTTQSMTNATSTSASSKSASPTSASSTGGSLTTSNTVATTSSIATTTSNTGATATGAAAPIEWKAEIAVVLGFAAVVALL